MNSAALDGVAWVDWIVAVLLVGGAAFALIGSYGLAKLSDFYKRLHGPTKASTLGVGCVLIASMLYFTFRADSTGVSLHELLITFCDERRCRIQVDGRRLGTWMVTEDNRHRFHVRVFERKRKAERDPSRKGGG